HHLRPGGWWVLWVCRGGVLQRHAGDRPRRTLRVVHGLHGRGTQSGGGPFAGEVLALHPQQQPGGSPRRRAGPRRASGRDRVVRGRCGDEVGRVASVVSAQDDQPRRESRMSEVILNGEIIPSATAEPDELKALGQAINGWARANILRVTQGFDPSRPESVTWA